MKQIVDEWKPHLVNTHNLAGFGTGSWSGVPSSIPLVHTVRDYYLLCVRTTLYRRDHRCRRICTDCRILTAQRRRSSRRPNVVVGVSDHVVRRHREAGLFVRTPSATILNTPAPVDITERQIVSGNTIGFIGRLEPAKGLGVLIAALTMQAEPELRLVVAGTGRSDHEKALVDAAARDPRITWLGRVTPADFFGRVEAVAVPTQWDEPFGRVAAEARSCGIPVIASDVGGLREALAGYDRARFVSDYEAPSAWADAMTELLGTWPVVTVGGRRPAPFADATRSYAELFRSMIPPRPPVAAR